MTETVNYGNVVAEVRATIQNTLPDAANLNQEDAAAIAMAYGAVFAEHFLPWMRHADQSAVSTVAREATTDNIQCEERDDHPGMLRAFVAPIAAAATPEAKGRAEAVIRTVQPTIARLTELSRIAPCGIHLMALLENTSADFIAWMYPGIANKFVGANRMYLDVHGIADQAHADAFVSAFEAERGHVDWRNEIEETTDLTIRLLTDIFTAHRHAPPVSKVA
ncbi:MAG TPA: hypothetical protein VGD08_23140 [Stellaceae bacterium]|jgi:hypothetical protein